MPSSKEVQPRKATKASAAGRAMAAGAKPPTAREERRASAPKSTQGAQTERLERGAPQDPSQYTATVWGTDTAFEVTLPSGQKCLARELTIERLIEMGLLESINSLESIVGNQVLPAAQGQRPQELDMEALLTDAGKIMPVLELVNAIIVEAVVAPKVYPVPEDGEERIAGRVYVDSIGMTDRFALFAEVTGNLESLSTFR